MILVLPTNQPIHPDHILSLPPIRGRLFSSTRKNAPKKKKKNKPQKLGCGCGLTNQTQHCKAPASANARYRLDGTSYHRWWWLRAVPIERLVHPNGASPNTTGTFPHR